MLEGDGWTCLGGCGVKEWTAGGAGWCAGRARSLLASGSPPEKKLKKLSLHVYTVAGADIHVDRYQPRVGKV